MISSQASWFGLGLSYYISHLTSLFLSHLEAPLLPKNLSNNHRLFVLYCWFRSFFPPISIFMGLVWREMDGNPLISSPWKWRCWRVLSSHRTFVTTLTHSMIRWVIARDCKSTKTRLQNLLKKSCVLWTRHSLNNCFVIRRNLVGPGRKMLCPPEVLANHVAACEEKMALWPS